MSCTPCKFMTWKCIFRQRHIVSLSLQRKVSICMVSARLEKAWMILKHELWLVVGHVYCVWVRLWSHHTWITPSKRWITAELLRRVHRATLTKQMGSLSVILPVEGLDRGKEAHMDLSFQRLDLPPQPYSVSMTMTLLFFCVLMDFAGGCLFIVRPLISCFIVQKISHNLISLSNLIVVVQ